MKYRHSFHAGNFADVHKHVALLALLAAMRRKDKGFLYLDTHAGAGAYDLGAPTSRQQSEAKQGILALAAAQPVSEELRDYLQAIEAWQRHRDDSRSYPGSPALAAQALRPQDHGICCELLPRECRALERTLGGFRRVLIECADGYGALKSRLPSAERRSLVLIDPPYEAPEVEERQASAALALVMQRQANAVVALWYPIKNAARAPGAALERELAVPALRLELWIYPRDSRVGLNGSGLLILNPPYHFAERAEQWQRELWSLLDVRRRGGSSVAASSPDAASASASAVAAEHAGA